ncbi:hypothetical protein CL620_01710 [archaeon]|nr:hypothetical protein [archaeon]|tara:strand:+ start:91 stop:1029 length:939 start_codon:yes stop_codon:yes gene_type:complete
MYSPLHSAQRVIEEHDHRDHPGSATQVQDNSFEIYLPIPFREILEIDPSFDIIDPVVVLDPSIWDLTHNEEPEEAVCSWENEWFNMDLGGSYVITPERTYQGGMLQYHMKHSCRNTRPGSLDHLLESGRITFMLNVGFKGELTKGRVERHESFNMEQIPQEIPIPDKAGEYSLQDVDRRTYVDISLFLGREFAYFHANLYNDVPLIGDGKIGLGSRALFAMNLGIRGGVEQIRYRDFTTGERIDVPRKLENSYTGFLGVGYQQKIELNLIYGQGLFFSVMPALGLGCEFLEASCSRELRLYAAAGINVVLDR